MRCFRSLALAGAFGTLVVVAAQAADMAFPPMEGSPEVSRQPVEWGTGWYLRGDVGWSRDQSPMVVPGPGPAAMANPTTQIAAPSVTLNGYSIDVGFGYKFNNWLRADIVYDYRKPQTAGASNTVWCPYTLQGLTSQVTPQNPNALELGYFANPNDTCSQRQSVKVSRQDVLLNGYIDLGTWAGITPYIGAGVGVAVTQTAASVNYFETANGQPYNANLTPTGTYPPDWITDQLDINGNPIYATISNGQLVACPVGATPQTCTQPKVSFTQQSWNKKLNSTKYGFAWDLTGGFAVDVSAHMKLDIGYRYVNLGTFTGISPSGQTVSEKQSTQEIRAGFRYMVD